MPLSTTASALPNVHPPPFPPACACSGSSLGYGSPQKPDSKSVDREEEEEGLGRGAEGMPAGVPAG
jgi:hypothetical protein